MKATPELIAALRKAAQWIDDHRQQYDWVDSDRCACGILAHAIEPAWDQYAFELGPWEKLYRMKGYPQTTVARFVGQFKGDEPICPVTFLRVEEVADRLLAVGLTYYDLGMIEQASHPLAREAWAEWIEDEKPNLCEWARRVNFGAIQPLVDSDAELVPQVIARFFRKLADSLERELA